MSNKKKLEDYQLVCQICGGSNIETKMWVDVHTDEVMDSCFDSDIEGNWCRDCEDHVGFITHGDFKKK